MNYYHPSGLLAWELRRRPSVALSVRAACAIGGLACEAQAATLLSSMALVLPLVTRRDRWLVDPGALPPWPAPRNAGQRAALVAWHLYEQPLTVRQTAALAGLAYNSAYILLCRLSQVIPIIDIGLNHHPAPHVFTLPASWCNADALPAYADD